MYILAHANLNVNLQVIASGAQRSATVAGQSSIKSQTIGQSSICRDAWDITTLRILVYHIRKDGQSRSQTLIDVAAESLTSTTVAIQQNIKSLSGFFGI